ncbi:MAG: hypothetical protein EOP05_08600, partial [Proteobacteria bacterium]
MQFQLGFVTLGYATKSATESQHTLTIANDDFAPTITQVNSTQPNGSYGSGIVPISIQFSQTVNVTGTPSLKLETGATDRLATYVSGSGTTTLIFNYAVQAGDASLDLDYTDTAALELSGGLIKSAADGLDANLTLPAPGSSNSLGSNKQIVIDTIAP